MLIVIGSLDKRSSITIPVLNNKLFWISTVVPTDDTAPGPSTATGIGLLTS